MAADGSVIIRIDGDSSGFEGELKDVNSQISSFGSAATTALKGTAAAIAGVSTALVGATGYAVDFANDAQKAINSFEAATGIAEASANGFEDAMMQIYNNNFGDSLEDISAAMATVAQISGEIDPNNIGDLTQNALMLQDAFGFDIQEQIRAVSMMMDQFGVSGTEAFNLIAQGAQGGLDKNGDLLDSINEYSVHFAQLGLDAEDMFNSFANGAAAGTFSIDKLGDAVKEFGIRAKDGSDTTMEAFASIGLDADETAAAFAAGGERASQAFADVTDALFAMDDPLAQNTAGVALFGTMWEDLGADGVKALADLNGGISTTTDALGAINAVKYDDFDSAIAGLGRVLQTNFVLPIGEQALPIFSDFVNEVSAGAASANGDVSKMAEAFGEALSGLSDGVATILPQIADVASEIVMGLVNGLAACLPQISTAAVGMITTLLQGLIEALPLLLDGAIEIIMALANGIGQALPQLVPKIIEVVVAIVQTLIDNIPLLVDAAIQLIQGLVQGLLDGLPILIAAIPNIVTSLVDALLASIPQLIDAGIQLLTALVDALPDIIAAIVEAIPEIIDGILTALLDNIDLIIQAGIDLLTALVEGLPTIIQSIVDALPDLIDGIITALMDNLPAIIDAGVTLFLALIDALPQIITTLAESMPRIIEGIVTALTSNIDKIIEAGITLFVSLVQNLPAIIMGIIKAVPQIISALVDAFVSLQSSIAEAGLNIVTGIWEGIKNAAGWLKDKVVGFATGILDSIKGALGIHSPSRVMRDQVGKMISMGIALGIKDKTKDVTGSIAAVSDAAIKAAKASAGSYAEIGESYIDNLTYAINTGVDASVAAMEQWVEANVDAYNRKVDSTTESMVAAKERQMDKVGKTQKEAIQKEIDAIEESADAQKKAYEDAGKEVTDAYKDALTDGYDEALQITKDRITEITDEFQSAHDDILAQQEDMQSKLADFGDLFVIDDETGDLSLVNLDAHIEALRAYDKALSQLQMRKLPDGFIDQVTALGVEEATKFAQALVNLPAEEFGSYMAAWQMQQDLAKGIAEQFYRSQLDTLNKSFTAKLDAALASVPSTLSSIGQNSIQGMIDGMYSKSGALSTAAADIVRQAINAMRDEADIHSPSGKTRDLVGEPLAQGVGVGFGRALPDVLAQMRGAVTSEVGSLSAVAADQTNAHAAQYAPAATQSTYYHEYVETTPTINLKGDMAALARHMYPYIEVERKRRGDKMVKGGTTT